MRFKIPKEKPKLTLGDHILLITKHQHVEKDGYIAITFTAKDNASSNKRFYYRTKDGEFIEAGLRTLGYLYRAATNDLEATYAETSDLIGKYVKATVFEKEYPEGSGKIYIDFKEFEPVMEKEKFVLEDDVPATPSYTNAPQSVVEDLGL